MEAKLILAGVGGQGVVFLTRLLVQAAMALNRPVLASETHGMSQRGGAVISHLRIGGDPAPLIRRGTADLLLALDAEEGIRNLPFLRPGGTAVLNSNRAEVIPPAITTHLERLQIALYCLPASQMALELGAPAVANVIMAGYAAAQPALALPLETLQAVVGQMSRRGTAVNQQAILAGYQAGAVIESGNLPRWAIA